MPKNAIYAQAGGATSVINASAYGVFQTIKQYPMIFNQTYVAINGIAGILEENIVSIDSISDKELAKLSYLPGAAFEACRFDLDTLENNPEQYKRVLEVFKTYDIGFFFYNGGNGSMVTAQKVADYCTQEGHKVNCIGIAKTIDNDLAISHCSPGFGSAAKYIATSLAQASLDIRSMYKTSTKLLIMDTMGRNTGWLTLAGGLVKEFLPETPLMVLPAEMPFKQDIFLQKVAQMIKEHGYCICVVSEGIKDTEGKYINYVNIEHTEQKDYYQLGGAGIQLSQLAKDKLQIKTHVITPDYLQRSATHLVSKTDWEMAYQAGEESVKAAADNQHGILPVIEQTSSKPFRWKFKPIALTEVTNLDKNVPEHFINTSNNTITKTAVDYLMPLIQGEKAVPFHNGIPELPPLKINLLKRKLLPFKAY